MTLAEALDPFSDQYNAGFMALMNFVLPHEVEFEPGHYGDYDYVRTEHDPDDPGGTTRYGLDAASHPHLDIANLTLGAALAEYHDGVWMPLHGDDLSAVVALCLCDAAINCGADRAVRWLQQVAGATVDGQIGPHTLAAVAAMAPQDAASQLNALRLHYYQDEVRPALRAKYEQGWDDRMADLNSVVAALA